MSYRSTILSSEADQSETRLVVDIRYAPMPQVGQVLRDELQRPFKVCATPLHEHHGYTRTIVVESCAEWAVERPVGDELTW